MTATTPMQICVVGIGTGDPALLTQAGRDRLVQATLIFSPTPHHPALAGLPVHALAPDPAQHTAVLEYATAHGNATLALLGSPDDHPAMLAWYRTQGCVLHLVAGVSVAAAWRAMLPDDPALATAHLYHLAPLLTHDWLAATPIISDVQAWSVTQQRGAYQPPRLPYPLQTTAAALIWLDPPPNTAILAELTDLLLLHYPADHPAHLLSLDRTGTPQPPHALTLADVPALAVPARGSCALYLPPLALAAQRRSTAALEWVVARLLGPGGCPWDVQQTAQSLRATLREEAYEVLEALDAQDTPALCEELGDLLLQVVVQSEMARQAGDFALPDVLEQVTSKLIRRHPHVFGDLTVSDTGTVLHNWEQIKAHELRAKGRTRESALDGIPRDLPALATAQKYGSKAARIGFDWATIEQIWGKLDEELAELRAAYAAWQVQPTPATHAHLREEFGDLLYAAVQLARWLTIDAESALREANAKYRRRFQYVERDLRERGQTLQELTLAEKVAQWQAAKQHTAAHPNVDHLASHE